MDSGRSKAPVISKHCVMHVCADTQKTDWTRPPVPDTALHVCHGLLAQIHDRTPQSFKNPWLECVCVCVYTVSERVRAALVSELSCRAGDSC